MNYKGSKPVYGLDNTVTYVLLNHMVHLKNWNKHLNGAVLYKKWEFQFLLEKKKE